MLGGGQAGISGNRDARRIRHEIVKGSLPGNP